MATTKRTTGNTETALETRQTTALARPSFIKEGDTRGTENITTADIKPPALRIAQSGTPETKRAEAAYVEGLREGDFFDSITKEIFGEGPLKVIIVNQLGHRHVEFAPQSEGGGVLDFNVPDGDPRTEFTDGTDPATGKKVRVKPRATKFYDYLVLLVTEDGRREMMTISLKSTQLKKATQLNTILMKAKMPSFALAFNVTTQPEKRGNNTFYGWRFDPAGYVTEDEFNFASGLYDKMSGVKIEVATEGDEPAGDEPFNDQF